MAKRGSIVENMRISKAGETKAPRAPGKMKTTAINIPVDTWTMLRAAAFARAQETGGRPSVSTLIMEFDLVMAGAFSDLLLLGSASQVPASPFA